MWCRQSIYKFLSGVFFTVSHCHDRQLCCRQNQFEIVVLTWMKGRISSHVTFFKSCSIVSHRRHPATHWSTGTHTHRQSLVGCVRCSVGGSVGVSKHHYAWSLKNTSRLRYNPVNKEIENTPVTPEWEYSATSTRCSLQTAGEEVWNVGKCSVGLWCLLACSEGRGVTFDLTRNFTRER